jgi:ABC-2 type transport system permease protein
MNTSWFAGLAGAFRREWRRMASDRFYPAAMVVVPVLAAAVLGAVFDPAVLRGVPVAICNQDGSALSRRIVRLLDATPELAVAWQVNDAEAGHALLRTGRCQAMVHLRRGLEKDLIRGTPQPVIAYIGNTFLLPAGNVEKALQAALISASVSRAAGLRMAGGAMAPAAAAAARPIRLDTRVVFNPYLNYAYLITATLMPAMLNIVVVAMSIFAFGSELRYGSADGWLAAAGGHPWAAVAGKALAHAVVFWTLALAMLAWLVYDQHLVLAGSGLRLWGATVLLVATGQAAALAFVAATANLRLALSLGGVWAVTAYPFAGITFPMVGMPLAARIWGESQPLTHYLRIFFDQTLRGALPGPEGVNWSVLGGVVLVATVLAMVRLPRLMRDPSYWGRR